MSQTPARTGWSGIVLGAILSLVGALMVKEAFSVPAGRSLIAGPRLFPVVITVVFTALALAYLGQQLLARARQAPTDAEPFGDVVRVAGMVVVLVVYTFLLEPLGYVLATFLLFVAGSRLLGSKAIVRDLVVGVGLSVGIYLLFTHLLNVHLPEGVIPLG